ncbi:MAG TPA: T9SS type A sorting domain-containing protein [Chitinophagaceae bacterium]
MRKIYLLFVISAFTFHGIQAQTCSNAPSAGPCTGGNVTADFNSNSMQFTSATLTYDGTGGNWTRNPAARNTEYTLSSGTYVQNTTGGNLGFSLAGTTAGLDDVTIIIRDANTNAILFSCIQLPANFISANQVCIQYSGLTAGTSVRYEFIFDTQNGAAGDGVIVFDNFANGGSAISLPVKLDNFEAAKEGSAIKLSWQSSEEAGVSRYEIQRSADGINFQTIGTVSAANMRSYTYVDVLPSSANNFYRLRIVDLDNVYRISHIVSVKSKVSMNIEAYPNPVRDRMIVQHPKAISGTRLQLVNLSGQVLKDVQIPANAVVTPLDLTGFKSGTYYIVFRSGAENFSQRITKQ